MRQFIARLNKSRTVSALQWSNKAGVNFNGFIIKGALLENRSNIGNMKNGS